MLLQSFFFFPILLFQLLVSLYFDAMCMDFCKMFFFFFFFYVVLFSVMFNLPALVLHKKTFEEPKKKGLDINS